MYCLEITLDFFQKGSFSWKDALRHTLRFMFVNVLWIYLQIIVGIFSHQVSYTRDFLSPCSEYKRLSIYLVRLTIYLERLTIYLERLTIYLVRLTIYLVRLAIYLVNAPWLFLPSVDLLGGEIQVIGDSWITLSWL